MNQKTPWITIALTALAAFGGLLTGGFGFGLLGGLALTALAVVGGALLDGTDAGKRFAEDTSKAVKNAFNPPKEDNPPASGLGALVDKGLSAAGEAHGAVYNYSPWAAIAVDALGIGYLWNRGGGAVKSAFSGVGSIVKTVGKTLWLPVTIAQWGDDKIRAMENNPKQGLISKGFSWMKEKAVGLFSKPQTMNTSGVNTPQSTPTIAPQPNELFKSHVWLDVSLDDGKITITSAGEDISNLHNEAKKHSIYQIDTQKKAGSITQITMLESDFNRLSAITAYDDIRTLHASMNDIGKSGSYSILLGSDVEPTSPPPPAAAAAKPNLLSRLKSKIGSWFTPTVVSGTATTATPSASTQTPINPVESHNIGFFDPNSPYAPRFGGGLAFGRDGSVRVTNGAMMVEAMFEHPHAPAAIDVPAPTPSPTPTAPVDSVDGTHSTSGGAARKFGAGSSIPFMLMDANTFKDAYNRGDTGMMLSSGASGTGNAIGFADDAAVAMGYSGILSNGLRIGLGGTMAAATAGVSAVNIARVGYEDKVNKKEEQGEIAATGVGALATAATAGAVGGPVGIVIGVVGTGAVLTGGKASHMADDFFFADTKGNFAPDLKKKTHLHGAISQYLRKYLPKKLGIESIDQINLTNPEHYNCIANALVKLENKAEDNVRKYSSYAPQWMRGMATSWKGKLYFGPIGSMLLPSTPEQIQSDLQKHHAATRTLEIVKSAQTELKEYMAEANAAKLAVESSAQFIAKVAVDVEKLAEKAAATGLFIVDAQGKILRDENNNLVFALDMKKLDTNGDGRFTDADKQAIALTLNDIGINGNLAVARLEAENLKSVFSNTAPLSVSNETATSQGVPYYLKNPTASSVSAT